MIDVQSLSRYYGSRCAVDRVSFSISSNEVVGFLGLNGAGKTTTLKVLAGLLLPSGGSVSVDGVDMSESPTGVRSRIGFLPEDPPLYQEMTVRDCLRFVGGLRGMSPSSIEDRLDDVLSRINLNEVADRVISELSHGFRKRVGIASAIIHSPKLVILDEPISGLDPVQIVEIREVIRGLKEECTVLLSSHILSEISQTCDRILVLNQGRLVAQGTETELAGRFHIGGSVDLGLRGDQATIRSIIEAQSGVKKLIELSAGEGVSTVRVSMADDVREALVGALVGAGIGIRSVTDAHDELEGIFLELTDNGGEA
jgi:ABC-2 type transport system ATP-binding protein|tara:strand:- start:410 stop:1345 length:936 start_codon:yes stop_codon:yes gene_type:complete